MFTDPQFRPAVPEISGGAIQDEIDQFDPGFQKHKRTGSLLKKRRKKLRSKLPIAYTKWQSSGQGALTLSPTSTKVTRLLCIAFVYSTGNLL
jgi:hypothetical protein